jgi:hypothetical protein
MESRQRRQIAMVQGSLQELVEPPRRVSRRESREYLARNREKTADDRARVLTRVVFRRILPRALCLQKSSAELVDAAVSHSQAD